MPFENKEFNFPTAVEIVVLESIEGTRRNVGECVGASGGFAIGNEWYES